MDGTEGLLEWVGMLMTSGGVGSRLLRLGEKEYVYALMRAWICMYLLRLLFRACEHGDMICYGNLIFRRFCFSCV